MSNERHVHPGRSSQGTYDPLMIFDLIGSKRGERILDAGCGDGYLSMVASRIVGGEGKVFSYDIHEHSIMILKKRKEHGNFKNIDARVQDLLEPLPIEDGTLDLIVFSNVFHGFIYNDETEPVIDMIRTKLRPGGRVAMIEFLKEETDMGPPVSHRVSPDELERYLNEIGLNLLDTYSVSANHYLAIFDHLTG